MRIAFVTPSLAMGGYEKVIVAYANELNKRGHQVDIICGFKKGELIDTVNNGIQIIDFQARARKFVFPLAKYLKNNQVDILYCGFRSYNSIGILAKKIVKARTCVYASQHGFQADGRLERLIKGRIIKHADYLTAVTQEVADFEAEQMHIDVSKFSILNNPVFDKNEVIKKERHPWFDENVPIIAVCGRIASDKGKNFCIEILKVLNDSMPVRMLVLGDGPDLDKCRHLARRLHIDDKVDFMGYVRNPRGYMSGCKLLLHTALEEGFGNIIVEALAENIPVCATSCTGPMYIIQDEKYGINLGKVSDADFVNKSAEKVLAVLKGEIRFEGLKERAADFEVKKATDMFLGLKEEQERKWTSH